MRTSWMFYNPVVRSVILYKLDTRVVYLRIGKILGGLHNWVVRRLTRRMPHQNLDGTWMHTTLVEGGVQEVETYATYRQNTPKTIISTRPIMNL